MSKPARAEDYEDAEAPVEALSGHVQSAGGTDELAGLLLETMAATVKINVLLGELDADEFAHVAPRVQALQYAAAQTPTEGRTRRKVGFAIPPKKKGRGK